jgi:hypothetical protein
MEIKMHSLSEIPEGMCQLYEWLSDCESETEFLKKEFDRISRQPNRVVMLAKFGNSITMFVNDISERR